MKIQAKTFRFLTISTVLVSCLLGCDGREEINLANGGSEVGNPNRVALSVVSYDSSLSRVGTHYLLSGLSIIEARIVLGSIQFRSMESCTDQPGEGRIDFNGPFVIDLLSNRSFPEIESADIPEGTYCKIDLRFDELSQNDLPEGVSKGDPIIGQSLLIRGSRSDGIPFVVQIKKKDPFKLKNQGLGFQVGSEGFLDFLIAFDLSVWFTEVDLATADLTSGTIIIDQNHNQSLLSKIRRNIKLSARLFQDLNENRQLETDEQIEVLAQGLE